MKSAPHAFSPPAFFGRIGIGRRDITPPVGIYARNWGAARSDTATGIHRPLTVTAVSFQTAEGEEPPLLLVALDLGWWRSKQEEAFFRDALVEGLGLDESRFILALSHTHAGPSFCEADAGKPGGGLVGPYLEKVRAAMVAAGKAALDSARPAILEAGLGWCDLAKNRDLPDPERNRWIVGWNPAVAADPTLLVGRISTLEGELLGTLVNYACHPTVLAWENEQISPDFVGAMRERVEKETGCPCAFMQGASGELAPAYQYVGDPAVADRHGAQLGYSVLATLFGMPQPGRQLCFEGALESGAPLALWREREREAIPGGMSGTLLSLPLAIREDLPGAREIREAIAQCTDRVLLERLHRKLFIRESLGDGPAYASPHRVWKLGEIVIVSVPNEAYSSLQLALREAAGGGRAVFLATVANEARGYLPPESFYEEDVYTVWQTPFAKGCLEAVTRELVAAVAKGGGTPMA